MNYDSNNSIYRVYVTEVLIGNTNGRSSRQPFTSKSIDADLNNKFQLYSDITFFLFLHYDLLRFHPLLKLSTF